MWKDAIWSKPADAHDFRSSVVEVKAGVPQGAPRSGDIFGFFNSDLPGELKAMGAGVSVRGVHITCGSFLDDSWIPTREHDIVRGILQTLADYGERWAQLWAANKFKVLIFNSAGCPAQWKCANVWVDTVTEAKVLGVTFHATRGWIPHFSGSRGSWLGRSDEQGS